MGVLSSKPIINKRLSCLGLQHIVIRLFKSVIILNIWLGAIFFNAPAIADESLEYGVKAAFLYKFGSYVEWPSTAFESPSSPLILCVLGSNDEFISTLEKVVGAGGINNRNVVVQAIKTVDSTHGCHIVYIDIAEKQRIPQAIESLRGSNVLTVSNGGSAGIINFVISDNRVRFNIDDDAAAQNGLVISSKLLSVALKVKKRTPKSA